MCFPWNSCCCWGGVGWQPVSQSAGAAVDLWLECEQFRMMKGITPRAQRVIYESFWASTQNSVLVRSTRLCTGSIMSRLLIHHLRRGIWNVNVYDEQQQQQRLAVKMKDSSFFLPTSGHTFWFGMSFMENRKPKTWMRIVRGTTATTTGRVNRCSERLACSCCRGR